jgi:hypothetical protein
MKSSILSLLTSVFLATGAYAFTNLGNGVLQSDGSAADTQATINAVTSGGTVQIPNGSYTWNQQVVISGQHLTLQGASKGGVTITNQDTTSNMLDVSAGSAGHVTIANINFQTVNRVYVYTLNLNRNIATPYTVLVHDCTFTTTAYTYSIGISNNGMIIWNCTFVGDGTLGGIICPIRSDATWNTPDTMGTADPTGVSNTYIEDCTFYDASTACTDFEDDSRAVVRHCTINDAALATHGQESGPFGVRHCEFYDNVFHYNSSGTGPSGKSYPLAMNYWIDLRGGTLVCTGNQMDDIPYGKTQIELNVYSIQWPGQIPCQTAYPAARQVGYGWSASSTTPFGNPVVLQDGIGQAQNPVYVWDNTGDATTDPAYVGPVDFSSDGCGNGLYASQFIQQGRDYYINVAKPSWARYTYPHPLRSGTGAPPPSPTPPPPQNLRIMP